MTFMQFVKSYYKKLSYVISILYIWEVRAHAKQPSVWGWNRHISLPPPKLFVLIPHDTITSDTMPSTVIVKMNTCSKTHKVTVSMRNDGNLDVDIQTDCKNVQHYADHLKLITIDDATNFTGSKIIDPDIRGPLRTVPLPERRLRRRMAGARDARPGPLQEGPQQRTDPRQVRRAVTFLLLLYL